MFISNVYFICEPKMSFKIHEASVVEKKKTYYFHIRLLLLDVEAWLALKTPNAMTELSWKSRPQN